MYDFFLKIYPTKQKYYKFIPAKRHREWQKNNPYVFHCGPLNNANSFGWDITTPEHITVSWNGGTHMDDVVVFCEDKIAISNFGHGTITFVIGATVHTAPGWSCLVSPVPNKDNFIFEPYSALVETDNLKYPLFVTAKIRKPGKFDIPKGTPVCRIIPILLDPVIDVEPEYYTEPDEFLDARIEQARSREKHKSSKEFDTVKRSRPYRSENLKPQNFYKEIANHPLVKMKRPKS